MGLFRRGNVWWYEFIFARRRVRESAKTTSKTVAKEAEKNRRRELEKGFNGVEDNREDRVRSIKEMAAAYLEEYCLRHKSVNFATYAIGNVTRHLGESMAVDVTEQTVIAYQTMRLKENAAPKTINEEIGFLLRLLGDAGDVIRTRLRRRKALKLAVPRGPGKHIPPKRSQQCWLLRRGPGPRRYTRRSCWLLTQESAMPRFAVFRGTGWICPRRS
jgi:hypothetical protein